MLNIWEVLDDSRSYVQGSDVSLYNVKALQFHLQALLKVQESRVEFYNSVIKSASQSNALKKSTELGALWRRLQQKYKRQELRILQKISQSITN